IECAVVLFEHVVHGAEIVEDVSVVGHEPRRILKSFAGFLVTGSLVQARAEIVINICVLLIELECLLVGVDGLSKFNAIVVGISLVFECFSAILGSSGRDDRWCWLWCGPIFVSRVVVA